MVVIGLKVSKHDVSVNKSSSLNRLNWVWKKTAYCTFKNTNFLVFYQTKATYQTKLVYINQKFNFRTYLINNSVSDLVIDSELNLQIESWLYLKGSNFCYSVVRTDEFNSEKNKVLLYRNYIRILNKV